MKELVTRIFECGTVSQNWNTALDVFNAEFGVTASAIYAVHEFGEFSKNFFISEFHKKNLSADFVNSMGKGLDKADRFGYDAMFVSKPQKLYSEHTLLGITRDEDLPPSPVRDYVRSLGCIMRVVCTLNKRGPWMDGFFCQCHSATEWKSLIADKRAEFILPLMGQTIALGQTLQALRAQFKLTLSVLDALGLGVFLVDQTGCVIDHNKEAKRILEQADGLYLTPSKHLKLHNPDKISELEAMIKAANGLLRGKIKKTHTIMAAERPSHDYDYLISVHPLSDSEAELAPDFKCAFVSVIDPARGTVLSAEGLTMLGQLTDAESDVVDLLVQGVRPADISERRDVSLNTIKTQLKAIFQKLRCETQSDVIRIAAATRIPLEKK